MSNFEIALYILWTIAFAGWIISFVLHITYVNIRNFNRKGKCGNKGSKNVV